MPRLVLAWALVGLPHYDANMNRIFLSLIECHAQARERGGYCLTGVYNFDKHEYRFPKANMATGK